jgi:hypothetical protein
MHPDGEIIHFQMFIYYGIVRLIPCCRYIPDTG